MARRVSGSRSRRRATEGRSRSDTPLIIIGDHRDPRRCLGACNVGALRRTHSDGCLDPQRLRHWLIHIGGTVMNANLGRATLGGFVGTLAMTAMMYMVAPMMGLRMDVAEMLGSVLGGSWAAGMLMHFVNGTLIFPAIYTYALIGILPA